MKIKVIVQNGNIYPGLICYCDANVRYEKEDDDDDDDDVVDVLNSRGSKQMAAILDQKNYLEELNRHLKLVVLAFFKSFHVRQ